jgi:hypothetical protein
VGELDGLRHDIGGEDPSLAPWSLSFWRLRFSPRGRQMGP